MAADVDRIAYDPLYAMNNVGLETVKGPMRISALLQEGSKVQRVAYYMRPDVQAMLMDQLAAVGIQVEYEKPVVEYFESESAAGVVCQDGSRYEADVVVAADGIRSASHKLVGEGKTVPAKSSGHAIFRVAYPVELAIKDPLVAERFQLNEDSGKSGVMNMFHGYVL